MYDAAAYSASAEDRATTRSCLDVKLIGAPMKKITKPNMLNPRWSGRRQVESPNPNPNPNPNGEGNKATRGTNAPSHTRVKATRCFASAGEMKCKGRVRDVLSVSYTHLTLPTKRIV